MKNPFLRIVCALSLLVVCHAPSSADDKLFVRNRCFNEGWMFHLGDIAGAEKPGYDDSDWRQLNLPHDWAIEGDFSRDNPSGTAGGALPGGIGWYRKTFSVPATDKGRILRIDFDGAYMNATVYINGHKLGTRPYGYIPFSYDLTPYVRWGGTNVVAVRVDNAEQPNSRWYSGCGIYRNVWLNKLAPLHVAQWGTQVTTHDVSEDSARVCIKTTVQNDDAKHADATMCIHVLDADDKLVALGIKDLSLKGKSVMTVSSTVPIERPQLWSVSRPYIYKVKTTLLIDGKQLDIYTTDFGVRTFAFDAEKGFSLNGERMKINGVCMHHDLGCLGAAVNRRAIERQLEILKEMGCNGIRCSHNPPAPELLDLCDRMGFIVMDETFDMWRKKKTAHDYARYFNEWHERDLTDLVLRDRNHPSVMIWSIGNEVLEQWTDVKADTLTLEEANLILNFGRSADMLAKDDGEMSVNSLLTRKLADMIRTLDPTRPVTAGCNEPSPNSHLFRSGALDIIGFNYHDDWFAGVPEKFPGKPFIVTESVSGLMTRGHYRMPSDSVHIWPARWDIPFHDESLSCSSYDNCHVPWGNSHEGTLKLVRDNDFISGQYIWTGFDYIGEPTPYGWPARSSYFGVVDLAGFPKDIYYMYQSEWRKDKTVLHLFPHWNWQQGQTVDMWAYYNNADEAELYINGKSQGVRRKAEGKGNTDFHVMWRVTFEPGEVRVVTRKDGRTVAEKTARTAGQPAAIRLTPDRSRIKADGADLSFVTVEVVDKDGNLCPLADNEVRFSITGDGFVAGVDNGSQTSLERFKADRRKAFYGKCLVVVQNSGGNQPIHLTAKAEGLAGQQVVIETNEK